MKTLEEIGTLQLKELLVKNWMTHDGMWFFHCLQDLGIEKTNELNLAAIKSLAQIEIKRLKQILGVDKDRIGSFEELRAFFDGAFMLNVGNFMNGSYNFPEKNVMRWQAEDQGCWAYQGVKRLGVIERYQCGVMYRIFCWLDNLGVQYSATPHAGDGCLLHSHGKCVGDIRFSFP